jgi:hypothetical protein
LTRKRVSGDRRRRKEERVKSKGQGSGGNVAFTWIKKSDLINLNFVTTQVDRLKVEGF